MFTIPFALSGVLIALFVSGESLDMIGALGIVMLVGIVVNNGIVLVDYIDLLRERGWQLDKAIADAGQSRIRPILMTAMTTILGMVPMVLANGEGSEMWKPMGIVVIGGLLVSTLLTFFIVPTLYGAMVRHGAFILSAFFSLCFIGVGSLLLMTGYTSNNIIMLIIGIIMFIAGLCLFIYAIYLLAQIIKIKREGGSFDEPDKLQEMRKDFIFMKIKVKKGEKNA